MDALDKAFKVMLASEIKPLVVRLEHLVSRVDVMAQQLQNIHLADQGIRQSQAAPLGLSKQMLTIREVMYLVGRKQVWIYNQMKLGDFPQQRKVGRSSFWLKSEVDAWVARQLT